MPPTSAKQPSERETWRNIFSLSSKADERWTKRRSVDTMAADPQATADVKTFSAMLDYLLLRVMMASGQRCGAASNLNIQEYADGIWTESDGSLS